MPRPFILPRLVLAGVLAFAPVFTASRPAEATLAVYLSRAELVRRSEVIVRARVLGQTTALNPEGTQPMTWTRFSVLETLKGAPGAQVTLEQLGGVYDGRETRIAGDPTFAQGQEVVLFLSAGPTGYHLFAMAQAVWFVDRTDAPVVRRDLKGLSLVARHGAAQEIVDTPEEAPEDLGVFLADLRALVGRAP